MPKVPGVNHLDAVRAFEKAGFWIARQGKHIVMTNGQRILTLPRHNPINAFTMGGLVRNAGLTVEQFRELLQADAKPAPRAECPTASSLLGSLLTSLVGTRSAAALGRQAMTAGRGGVEYEDLVLGDGPSAEPGCVVDVRYDLFLHRGDKVQENQASSFRLGERRVIPGLEYGVEGMRVGGKRRLRVGPHLGYREEGVPGVVPANAVLEFHVTLVGITSKVGGAT